MICSLWFKSICAFNLRPVIETQPQKMATLRSSAGMDASAETNSKCQQIPESDIPKYASLLQVQNVIKKHKSFFKMSVSFPIAYSSHQTVN